MLASQGHVPAPWVLLPAGAILSVHVAEVMLSRRRDRARRKVALYAASLARVEGRWEPVAFTGEEFFPPDHPSVFDLDLVGERSLFAWLNIARTKPGARVLVTWLTQPANETALRFGREAIEELQGRLDLREAIWLAGQDGVARVDADSVEAWGQGGSKLPWLWLRWPLALLAWSLVGAAIGAALGWWGIVPLVATGVGVILAHAALRSRARAVVVEVIEPLHQLSVVAEIMAVLEHQEFRAPLLRELQDVLLQGGRASSAVRTLAGVVNGLMALRSEIVALIGLPLLWPSRKALQIEAWRQSHGERLGNWPEAVGTLEALLSIATYADEHPTHIQAEVVPEGPTFQARALGHPLLPRRPARVSNIRTSSTALLYPNGYLFSRGSQVTLAVQVPDPLDAWYLPRGRGLHARTEFFHLPGGLVSQGPGGPNSRRTQRRAQGSDRRRPRSSTSTGRSARAIR